MTAPHSEYLRFLFSPFFKNWWAVLTGCASLLALYMTPGRGVVLGGPGVMTLTFLILSLLFLTASSLSQGWKLYAGQARGLQVTSFDRNKEVSEGRVFVMSGDVDLAVGTLVDVYRRTGAAEVPLALARIDSKNSSGAYQATPVGKLNPIHIREHAAGGLRPADLVICAHIGLARIKEVIDDIR